MFLIVPALALSAGCQADDQVESFEVEIEHHLAACTGFINQTCMKIRQASTDDWEFLYEGIEGFDYEWGHRYRLQVRTERLDSPPEDVSGTTWHLEELISDEPVSNEEFDYHVNSLQPGYSPFLTRDEASGGELLGGVAYTCADASVCEAIDTKLDNNEDFSVSFRYSDGTLLPLIAIGTD